MRGMAAGRPDAPVLLADRLTAELKAASRGIPGLGGHHVGVVALATGRHVIVRTSMTGWSPVLHEVRIVHERQYELPEDDGATAPLADFIPPPQALEAILRLQRARAVDAAALGHRTFLPKREISHVNIDKALPHLMQRPPAEMRKAAHEAIARAHSSSHDYSGGCVLKAGGVLLGDDLREDGRWLRVALPHLKVHVPADRRRVATLRGFELDVEAPHLPDTVIDALPGRRVGDVVELHRTIDDRIITKAANRTHKARPGINLTIAIDVDPLDEVIAAATACKDAA